MKKVFSMLQQKLERFSEQTTKLEKQAKARKENLCLHFGNMYITLRLCVRYGSKRYSNVKLYCS
jgi:hypothetical protein